MEPHLRLLSVRLRFVIFLRLNSGFRRRLLRAGVIPNSTEEFGEVRSLDFCFFPIPSAASERADWPRKINGLLHTSF
jgi:hypothetical protein